jgi:hypothetical protein
MRASHTHPQSLSMSHEDEAAGNSTEGPANSTGGRGETLSVTRRSSSNLQHDRIDKPNDQRLEYIYLLTRFMKSWQED